MSGEVGINGCGAIPRHPAASRWLLYVSFLTGLGQCVSTSIRTSMNRWLLFRGAGFLAAAGGVRSPFHAVLHVAKQLGEFVGGKA